MKKLLKLGKHYCPDWDYLEIEPGDPEWHCCDCDKVFEEEEVEPIKEDENE